MSKKKSKEKVVEYSKLEHKVAAVWTRVSTGKQADNNGSLESQKRICDEYAASKGIRIKAYFGDTNESAQTEGKLYRNMIEKVAKDKEINVILVASYDRFSRTGPEGIMTKAYLKAKGIYVVSATQATDPDSAAGTFMENIIFLFNQFENSLRRDKTVIGMTDCLRKGNWYSKPPLGYDKVKIDKDHILTVNETGQILRNAFIWKATEGIKDIEIVHRLKGLGLSIDRKHLNKILHNPFYCGYIQHSLLGDEIIKGNQEILIDEATFNKVNGISNAGYEHKEITEPFPLKRHIICSDCGGYLTGYTVKARGRDYYKCNKKGCKSNHSTEKLHQKYINLLNGYNIPDGFIPILTDVLRKVFEEYNQSKGETKKVLLKRKTECENRINAVKVRFGLGEINSEIYTATMSELNSRLAEIRRELEDAGKNLSNMMKYINQTIEMSCKLGGLWSDSNFSNRQKIQNLVYPSGIYFDKENDDYRTENENEVFKIFRRFTASCEGGKEKATTDFARLSPSVGYTIELSNKFIVDFEKIIQFLGKYSNIQTETILKGK